MPQFSDDLFLGSAPTYMGTNATSNLGDPAPMDLGVGPVGRIYIWDSVPAAQSTTNVAASQTPAAAGNLTLTAGTSTTSVVRTDGTTVVQLDVPRNIRITQAALGTQRTFTVTGWDYYGQAMSEAITSSVGGTGFGSKAFFQIASIAVSGATTTACSAGTGNRLGVPVRVTNRGYVIHVGWDDALADNAGVFTDADSTSPATTTTGDVRGYFSPTTDPDGAKRLVMSIALTALACGPNATRLGALGVNQNLAS